MLSPLEEIKNRLDIVDIISQYVKLTKAGANYKALCPFHKEKTPSFFVSPSRQIWHCFGACNEGGDIFKFIMKIENVDFKEAVRILAEKAGVRVTFEKPEVHNLKQRLLKINEEAARFFQSNLKENTEVLNYLKKRGLKKETIEFFELGFAPDNWRALLKHLLLKGFKIEDIVESGLIISKREPEEISIKNVSHKIPLKNLKPEDFYDRFRSRIMFPIKDKNGNLVAFTGRIFQGKFPLKTVKDIEKTGKYVNSPQSIIFDKSKVLYGLFYSKGEILKKGEALIVEGQMDFLMTYQSGIRNIVATSGTSLTDFHFSLLKKYCQTLILAFDMDEAGQRATERTIEISLAHDFKVKVLLLEAGKDLADYFLTAKDSSPLFKNLYEVMDFYFERATKLGDKNTLEGKRAIADYFLRQVKKLNSAIERAFYLEKLALYLKIPLEVLNEEMKKIVKEESLGFQARKKEEVTSSVLLSETRLEKIAERILSLVIDNPLKKEIIKGYEFYFPEKFQSLLSLLDKVKDKESLMPEKLLKANIDEGLIQMINYLALRAEYEKEILQKFQIDILSEIKSSLKELKKEFLKEKLNNLEMQIKEAEQKKDEEKLKELLKEFNKLIKEISF
ncbi:MAG: DNA primase [Candidatus Paceibacterota bacterium]